jgi:hypothetical protein
LSARRRIDSRLVAGLESEIVFSAEVSDVEKEAIVDVHKTEA